jgi:hypothetical protein
MPPNISTVADKIHSHSPTCDPAVNYGIPTHPAAAASTMAAVVVRMRRDHEQVRPMPSVFPCGRGPDRSEASVEDEVPVQTFPLK